MSAARKSRPRRPMGEQLKIALDIALRAALAEQPQPPTDADFVIMWGRHKGRTLGSLSDSDLQWYAEQYRGKDATLQACARAVWDAREVETGEDFGEADCAGNPSHYG